MWKEIVVATFCTPSDIYPERERERAENYDKFFSLLDIPSKIETNTSKVQVRSMATVQLLIINT